MNAADEKPDSGQYDVVVIGGGAAGLSAGLALTRARRSVLVIDSGEPRNAPAGHVHNFLTREGTPPAELVALGRAEVEQYGGEFVSGTVVRAAPAEDTRPGEGFEVELADGRSVWGRRLLIATGLVDELPKVTGLAERWGRDVLHCPYCHGWEVRDQALGILASGPMALHQALMFRQWSADITLFLNDQAEPGPDQREELAARGITVVPGEVEALEVTDDRITGVRLRSGDVVARQAVVIGPNFRARVEMLAGLGLAATEMEMAGQVIGSHLAVDGVGSTAVPGVWAAGNVADPRAQVIGSAAAGLMAGAAINGDLSAEETRLAVSAYRAARA